LGFLGLVFGVELGLDGFVHGGVIEEEMG